MLGHLDLHAGQLGHVVVVVVRLDLLLLHFLPTTRKLLGLELLGAAPPPKWARQSG